MYLAIADRENLERRAVFIEDSNGAIAGNLSKASPPDIEYYAIDLSTEVPTLKRVTVDVNAPVVVSEKRKVSLKAGASVLETAEIEVPIS